MRYHHIIWDWNGTLLDDTWLCVELFNALLREHGLPETSCERHRESFDFPAENYYRKMGLESTPTAFAQHAQTFMSGYEARRTECALHPQATDTIRSLHNAGYEMSILSAYKEDTLRELLAHYQLSAFLSHITGQTNIRGEGKLDRVKIHLEKINTSGPMLMIGDSPHDFEVSRALKADCVLMTHGLFAESKLAPCGVPLVHNFEELRNYLACS